MCAVYWVIANISSKYRSTLNSIQLALLCNTSTVKECGYAKVLQSLIYDLKLLEQNGVYLEQLGASVKGTVLYVAADNLGAHSLAGFLESFTVDKFCRFCSASSSDSLLTTLNNRRYVLVSFNSEAKSPMIGRCRR